MRYSPVIILGMHRSGTTMVTDLLEKLGLFVGDKKEVNNESLFFIQMNTWLLREANAAWDDPHNFLFISDFFKQNAKRVVEQHLHGLKSIDFLGYKRFITCRDIRNLDRPWGWKDPRNTFTIDIWHEIFPDAKVLHIYRNPIDVAESLRKREAAKNASILEHGLRLKGFKLKKREATLKRRVGYQDSFKLTDIRENISLWEEYTKKALSLDSMLGKDILHVRYETLLENFNEQFAPILDFVGFQAKRSEIPALAGQVRADRKYAFLRNKDLVAVYQDIRNNDLMRKLDYHSIC
jgi:hypothetical protein